MRYRLERERTPVSFTRFAEPFRESGTPRTAALGCRIKCVNVCFSSARYAATGRSRPSEPRRRRLYGLLLTFAPRRRLCAMQRPLGRIASTPAVGQYRADGKNLDSGRSTGGRGRETAVFLSGLSIGLRELRVARPTRVCLWRTPICVGAPCRTKPWSRKRGPAVCLERRVHLANGAYPEGV